MRIQKAKLVKNGESQTVHLPPDLWMRGDQVFVRRLGESVILVPFDSAWSSLEESLEMFEGFMTDRVQQTDSEQQ